MTGAMGYGIEYTFPVMERIRLTALGGDRMLAMPIIATPGAECAKIKELKAPESAFPAWGDLGKRAAYWEAATATALLHADADLLILYHPEAAGWALAVTAPDLDGIVALTTKLKSGGFNNLVLDFATHSFAERFRTVSIARRMALKADCKALGYPHLAVLPEGDLLDNAVVAATEICKYGGVLVLPACNAALLAALMTLRLNIYTDPQKPIQVEPKLYPIGEPGPDSPVFVTTNFSLTYFIVSGEIENSGTSAWLLVPECEGMSVLAAWAAGNFSGASIAKFAKEIKLDEQVRIRQITIPGYVAQISGELEEALSGWKVLVGPQEAADLESYIKTRL